MKILLLTDVPPGKEFSGGLLTYQLCKMISSEDIVCVAVRNRNLSYVKNAEDLSIKTKYLTKPLENTFWFLSGRIRLLSRLSSFIFELYTEFFQVPKLAREIIDFGQEENIDRIWCILQGQTTIRLAKLVSKGLKVPLLTQVWDHPIWWMGHNNIDRFSSNRIIRLYDEVLSMSACCGAASFVMADKIKEHNQVPSVALVSCLPEAYIGQPVQFPDEDSKFITIGFSGQTYAEQAINSLYACLDVLDWIINGKQVRLRYLGYHFSLGGHQKRYIEYLGYRDQKETIDLLSECDLLFCPYIMDPKYTLVAQTSFPAKITTYLATGVPVLYVGTQDSSPALFLCDNDSGFLCFEPSSDILGEMLQRIFSDRERYEKVSRNSLAAFENHLTNEKQAELFLHFLQYGDESL